MATRALKSIHKLRVSNLPWTVGSSQLKQYFSQFGSIINTDVLFDRNTGLSKCVGFVEVADKDTYEAIIDKTAHQLEGHEIYIRFYGYSRVIS